MTFFLNFLKRYIYWKGEKGIRYLGKSQKTREKDLFDNVGRCEL